MSTSLASTKLQQGPLSGVKVLDIATVYAGPFAASLLGDMGADVIKIELPDTGDSLRGIGPFFQDESLTWSAVSRNKRSVSLDLRKEQGREVFLSILTEQDLLIENFRPGTLERWGLGVKVLREANPNLVIVRVSGYGQSGPMREKAGFGTPATAFSGLTAMSGYPDRPPVLPPFSLVDYVAGMFATIGAVSALYHRDALDGDGQEVDVALYESMFRLLEGFVAEYDKLGVEVERVGDKLPLSAPAGLFQSQDNDWLVLTTSTDRTFARLADVMGQPGLVSDPRFSSNRMRVENRSEIDSLVADWFAKHSTSEIEASCDAAGVPVSRVNRMSDIFTNEHFKAREMLVQVDHPKLGSIQLPGVVPKFGSTPGRVSATGALLGEHTSEVLTEVGYSPEQITEFKTQGVI